MEPECSLPCLQEPVTGPYPETCIQSTISYLVSLTSVLLISSHLSRGVPSGVFPSGFCTKTLYAFLISTVRVIWPAHLILLDLITLTISDKSYRSWNSKLLYIQIMLTLNSCYTCNTNYKKTHYNECSSCIISRTILHSSDSENG